MVFIGQQCLPVNIVCVVDSVSIEYIYLKLNYIHLVLYVHATPRPDSSIDNPGETKYTEMHSIQFFAFIIFAFCFRFFRVLNLTILYSQTQTCQNDKMYTIHLTDSVYNHSLNDSSVERSCLCCFIL